jgi:LPXTG-motif cell wall-anchored protein
MRAKVVGRWVFGAALGAAAVGGGTVAAGDYPPDDPTATTVPRGGATTTVAERPDGQLPATGSDTNMTLRIASGVIVTGAGLLVAARWRRRTTAA